MDSGKLEAAVVKLSELDQRLKDLETLGGKRASSEQDGQLLKQYQATVLDKLKLLKQKMLAEIGDIDAIKRERDVAIAESDRLLRENEQLNYRVAHLIKALNDAQAQARNIVR